LKMAHRSQMQRLAHALRSNHVSWHCRAYHGQAVDGWDRSDSAMKKAELWAEKRHNRDQMGMRYQSDWNTSRRGKPELRHLHDEIRNLGRERRWEEALAVLDRVEEPDVWLRIAAVSACGKSLQFDAARKIFQEMPEKTVPAYGVMMSLVGMRHPLEAQQLLEEMRSNQLEPDSGIYNAMIESHGRAQNMAGAMQAFDQLGASGQRINRATYQITLSACARTGDLQQAKALLARMEAEGMPPDAGHFTTLVTSCARTKAEGEARQVMETMKERGMTPDVITYTGLLSCMAGETAIDSADEVWQEMKAAGILPDASAYNALLGAALASGNKQRCLEIVADMEQLGFTKSREAQLRFAEVRNLCNSQTFAATLEQPRTSPAPTPSAPLPPGWQSVMDPTSGRHYYWQESDPAGTTTWERPS